MNYKKVTIITTAKEYYFLIGVDANNYLLFKVENKKYWTTYAKKDYRIGECRSLEDVIALAKTSTIGNIKDIKIE